jgi:hypothetical protein
MEAYRIVDYHGIMEHWNLWNDCKRLIRIEICIFP